jgi:hypothetical protein
MNAIAGRPVASEVLPNLLYVGGFSRSGSTLIGRVLGESDGAICVGETRYLWHRGVIHNVQCGCGHSFRSCPFWEAVGGEAFGGWHRTDAERLARTDRLLNRLRSLPAHSLPSIHPAFTAAISHYVSQLARLYSAIALISGASTIVETSKDPNFAWALTRMQDYDVRILHLVRDSRAVACSWVSPKRMTSPIGGEAFMPTFGAANTATRWTISNAAFHALGRRAPYLRCSYEDFVRRPQATLDALGAFSAEPLTLPATHLDGNQVHLGDHHIFSGNPMSARKGWVEMRPDERWTSELSGAQVATVTALTWPLLRSYGYPIVARGERHAER